MANDSVLIFLGVVVTIAILMQASAMVGMWLAVRKIPGQITQIRSDVRQHLDPLALSVTELLNITREPLRTVTSNLAEISQTMRERSTQVDRVVDDLVDKRRLHIIPPHHLLANL